MTSSAPRHHPRIDTELAAWYHVSDMPAYDNILSRRPLGRVRMNCAFWEHFEAGAHTGATMTGPMNTKVRGTYNPSPPYLLAELGN